MSDLMFEFIHDGIMYGIRHFEKPSRNFIDLLGDYIKILGYYDIEISREITSYYVFHNNALQDESSVKQAYSYFVESAKIMIRRYKVYSAVTIFLSILLLHQIITGLYSLPSTLVMLDIISVLISCIFTVFYVRSYHFVLSTIKRVAIKESNVGFVSKESRAFACGLANLHLR